MDGLSTAASGFAIVSVTIQLADGIKKLHDFWNSIREAPEDIKDNLLELKVLSSLLTQIAHDKQRHEPDQTFADVLSGCCAKVNRLATILEELEPGFASTSSYVRRWTATKAVLKREKLKKFQDGLERLKSALSLALQHQNRLDLSSIRCLTAYSASPTREGPEVSVIQTQLSLFWVILDVMLVANLETNPLSRLSQDQQIFMKQSLVTLTQHLSILSIQENQQGNSSLQTTVSEIHSGHTTSRGKDWNTTELAVAKSTPSQSDLLFDQSDFPDSSSGTWRRNLRSKRILTEEESTTHFMFGTVRIQSKTKLQISSDEDDLTRCGGPDQCERESTYTIYPSAWLVWLGIRCGLRLGFQSSPIQGWKNTLNTFRPVPDDALIFKFCKDGNLPAVRTLLLGGQASARDTDSWGFTPLHVSAFHEGG
ncbi:MAG: hypothetical protein Q9178_003858 [Gyalolechia marmorata]